MYMSVIEMVGVLSGAGRLTDDEITDLIETIVDRLDAEAIDPSVGTTRHGNDVELTVEVTIAGQHDMEALTTGSAAVVAAVRAAGIELSRPRLSALQSA